MAESHATIAVEVVHVGPDKVWSRTLELTAGSTVRQAVDASGFTDARPDVNVADDMLGVFGHRTGPDQVLHDGDRVEIYRPLALDPMEARRQRARTGH